MASKDLTKINIKDFKIYPFDTKDTIAFRYASTKTDALPSYFYVDINDLNDTYSIEDIRSVVKRSSNGIFDNTIFAKYPNIKRKELGILWIMSKYTLDKGTINGLSLEVISNLKYLDSTTFASINGTEASVERYITSVVQERRVLVVDAAKQTRIFNELNKKEYALLTTQPFNTEEITSSSNVDIKDSNNIAGADIVELFDCMDVSHNLPFIILSLETKTHYKVNSTTLPHKEWVDYMPDVQGLFFWALPKGLPTSRRGRKDHTQQGGDEELDLIPNSAIDNYSRCHLYFDINLRMYRLDVVNKANDITTEENLSFNHIVEVITESFLPRKRLTITNTTTSGIKGKFTINNLTIERAIMGDMILNDKILSYFLFCNESVKSFYKKRDVFLYYMIGVKHPTIDVINAFSIKLIPTTTGIENTNSVEVRVTNARTYDEIKSISSLLTRLMNYYINNKDDVVRDYTELLSYEATARKSKAKAPKVDTKSGIRIINLRKKRPDLYESGYSEQCQQKRQPYIINEADVKELIKTRFKGNDHKVMKFDGDYYACEPREVTDKNQTFVWPGLTNTNKMPAISDKHPSIPCCFDVDHYIKEESDLRKYIAKEQGLGDIEDRDINKGVKFDSKSFTHILGSTKMAMPGRYGKLPFTWTKILNMLKIPKFTRSESGSKAEAYYSVLRQGVSTTSDSFIHCMERIFNPRYIIEDLAGRNTLVRDALANMIKLNSQSGYAYQELVNVNISSLTTNKDVYIDPKLFISLATKLYKCNIFLYAVDEKHPDGEIVIPNYYEAELSRNIDENNPTVLIFMMETNKAKSYPYVCEVGIQLVVKDGKITSFKTSFNNEDALAKQALYLYLNCNEVFIVNSDVGAELYTPPMV